MCDGCCSAIALKNRNYVISPIGEGRAVTGLPSPEFFNEPEEDSHLQS